MTANSILVISNNGHMNQIEKQNFEDDGYIIQETSLDFKPPKWAEDSIYDLFILNLNSLIAHPDWASWMPNKMGVPIMVLTTSRDYNFAVELLNAGADDIVPRPFRTNELLARVRAVLRRAQRNYQPQDCSKSQIRLANLTIHMDGRRIFSQNNEIRLTRTEFNLFSTMVTHLDKVCTHSELLARVWGWEYWDATQYLYVYMGRLRNKLGEQYAALVETVPGIGYILHAS